MSAPASDVTRRRILLVDDDPTLRETLAEQLGFHEEYTVGQAENGAEAITAIDADHFDAIVLDVGLPDMDGRDLCKLMRRRGVKAPIIMLTGQDSDADAILGLDAGANDYITKPFSPRELVARVKAVLRRLEDAKAPRDEGTAIMQHGRLSLNLDDFTGSWDDTQIVLTLIEFGMIRTLMQRPGKVYSRDDLMSSAYELSRIVSDPLNLCFYTPNCSQEKENNHA